MRPATGYVYLVLLLLTILQPGSGGVVSADPVSYHISFDDLSVLDDCYVSRSKLKTPDERKLAIVDGMFGGALHLGAVPLIMDEDNMSGIDLDLVTAVIYNVAMAGRKGTGYDEPFIWGGGKLHPALGAVSFWVRGERNDGVLFSQTSSAFGRTEKELIEIRLEADGSISAYVEDACYVRHSVRTKKVWRQNEWMHVLFQWDRSSGVSLWIDGRESASSMGRDAWWENQRPGLFHFPFARAAYDEFYCFERLLTTDEIKHLHAENQPPDSDTPKSLRLDMSAVKRLERAFINDASSLPRLVPSDGDVLTFRHITPADIHDEGVSGWWLGDGRYECAWPHEYALFTIVPGDADYHADHADIMPPDGADINYITAAGNLSGFRAVCINKTGEITSEPVATAGSGGFLYGGQTDITDGNAIRLPFTQEYGTPPGFGGEGVRLPLSGDLRVHEIGLFHVSQESTTQNPGDVICTLTPVEPELAGSRYDYALHALLSGRDRKSALMTASSGPSESNTLELSPMETLNLFSEPSVGTMSCSAVMLDVSVTSAGEGGVLSLIIPNPAVPSQIWSHAEVSLAGFSENARRLCLALEFDPLVLAPGDRLWLRLTSSRGMGIITGETDNPSSITLRPCLNRPLAERKFARKTLLPAEMTYSKMFEYMPWRITGKFPDFDAPEVFGGPFDMVYPWQAVLRINPGDRTANTYRELITRRYDSNNYPPKEMTFPYNPPHALDNAPEWAVLFRDFQHKRERIIDWWRRHQRTDGQVGGGWNDDTLVFSSDHGREGGYSDMILDSYPDALALYNGVFDGFDETGLFTGGYCRIHPIDRLHNGDFIRERYKSLIYNPGDPRAAVRAMKEAWHFGKPGETPLNYGDGSAFLFGKNVLDWYWGRNVNDEPYVLDESGREEIISTLRRAASSFTDTVHWRFTEARVHTDDQSPYGSDIMHRMLCGGFGIREKTDGVYYTHVNITLGVGWPCGGGADLARLVEHSGNERLTVRLYSFDSLIRPVHARLYRLVPGTYRVMLSVDVDGDGSYEQTALDETAHLERFGELAFDVPPRVPALLDIRCIDADDVPPVLPDAAVSERYIKREGTDLAVTVHNIGTAPTGNMRISVFNAKGDTLATETIRNIQAPTDYKPRRETIRFGNIPNDTGLIVLIDPDNRIQEINEENNRARIDGTNSVAR